MVRQALKLPEILSDMKFTLRVLHNFPMGPEGQVFQLWHQQFLPLRILWPSQVLNVPIMNILKHSIDDRLDFVLYEKEDTPKSTSHWLRSLEHETHERCPQCFSAMMQPISFKSAPNVLIFEINSRNIKLSKTLKFEQEGETVILDVRGLIYPGDFHFTSHIIETDGIVWYHDGITTGNSCENEGDFDKFSSKKLLKYK